MNFHALTSATTADQIFASGRLKVPPTARGLKDEGDTPDFGKVIAALLGKRQTVEAAESDVIAPHAQSVGSAGEESAANAGVHVGADEKSLTDRPENPANPHVIETTSGKSAELQPAHKRNDLAQGELSLVPEAYSHVHDQRMEGPEVGLPSNRDTSDSADHLALGHMNLAKDVAQRITGPAVNAKLTHATSAERFVMYSASVKGSISPDLQAPPRMPSNDAEATQQQPTTNASLMPSQNVRNAQLGLPIEANKAAASSAAIPEHQASDASKGRATGDEADVPLTIAGTKASVLPQMIQSGPKVKQIIPESGTSAGTSKFEQSVHQNTLPTAPTNTAQPAFFMPSTLPATASADPQSSTKAVASDAAFSLLAPSEAPEFFHWDATRSPSPTAGAAPLRADLAPHVARQLVEVMAHAPHRPTEIALSPAELGRVRMSIATDETGITVNILAERGETLDLMRRHIDQLGQTFRSMGYDQITFAFGQGTHGGDTADQQNAEDQTAESRRSPRSETIADASEPSIIQLDRGETRGVDIRL